MLPFAHIQVAVWHSGNNDGQINKITLHRAWLVPGWATVRKYAISHLGQLSLLPWAAQKMSIGK